MTYVALVLASQTLDGLTFILARGHWEKEANPIAKALLDFGGLDAVLLFKLLCAITLGLLAYRVLHKTTWLVMASFVGFVGAISNLLGVYNA